MVIFIYNYNNDVYVSLINATRDSLKELFQLNEHFYYCSLMILDDATPCISAWSEESLNNFIYNRYGTINVEKSEIMKYKWSYADSPYFAYGYKKYFQYVEGLFNKEIDLSFKMKQSIWINQMENIIRELDEEGIFNNNGMRDKLFINAEIMPPDETNIERGKRLNSTSIFDEWFNENWNIHHENEELYDYYYSLHHPQLCKVVITQPRNDKKTAIKIRKDFNVSMGLGEFSYFCLTAPCVINESFNFETGEKIISQHPEYTGIISLIKI